MKYAPPMTNARIYNILGQPKYIKRQSMTCIPRTIHSSSRSETCLGGASELPLRQGLDLADETDGVGTLLGYATLLIGCDGFAEGTLIKPFRFHRSVVLEQPILHRCKVGRRQESCLELLRCRWNIVFRSPGGKLSFVRVGAACEVVCSALTWKRPVAQLFEVCTGLRWRAEKYLAALI